MLEVANKYMDQLQELNYRIRYNDYYKYYNLGSYYDDPEYKTSDWLRSDWVSTTNGEVKAHMKAYLDRDYMIITELTLVNYSQTYVEFYSDFREFIRRLVRVGFRKICFSVIVGNPAERTYDRFVKRYGGRIVGTHKSHVKLIDGKYYDLKLYEVFTNNPKLLKSLELQGR